MLAEAWRQHLDRASASAGSRKRGTSTAEAATTLSRTQTLWRVDNDQRSAGDGNRGSVPAATRGRGGSGGRGVGLVATSDTLERLLERRVQTDLAMAYVMEACAPFM